MGYPSILKAHLEREKKEEPGITAAAAAAAASSSPTQSDLDKKMRRMQAK